MCGCKVYYFISITFTIIHDYIIQEQKKKKKKAALHSHTHTLSKHITNYNDINIHVLLGNQVNEYYRAFNIFVVVVAVSIQLITENNII